LDIPVPTGTLIPPNALRLLPPNFTGSTNSTSIVSNALFASIVGVHAVDAPEASMRERIISTYPTDAVASQHLTNPQHPWTCSLDGLLLYKGLIYIPESPPSLRMDILREHHDAPLVGHHGITKTIELITRNYWFPGIHAFTKSYIHSCQSCQQGKALRHRRHGELAPLPVPDSPWKGLSCDFIMDLPVSNGMDSILVFVD